MSKNKTSGLLRLFVVMAVLFTVSVQAQFATMNKILDRTAERRQANKDLSKITLDGKKFLLIRDFPDHTERNFISVNGDQLTFVEVFDDKQTGQSSSNVFSGDVVRTRHNMISLRADKLEGERIGLPLTKTLQLVVRDKTLYLKDIHTGDYWTEESPAKQK
ncbi:hypothetical protein [Chryseobacterium sp.]|uniref:hypothetical protein n=1 Tax=Chryseobacterium sp. TaxID=1871047 RepID=UPI001E423DDC|nr:hypothetical protein [Chryseobacterium sp.]